MTINPPPLSHELKWYLFVGFGTVIVAYLVMKACVLMGVPVYTANPIGFVVGSIFSYLMNSKMTFQRRWGVGSALRFTALYLTSLIIHGGLANALHMFLSDMPLRDEFAFLGATIVTTIINFLGLKYFVFWHEDSAPRDGSP